MRKRGPNDDELMAVLAGLPAEVVAQMLAGDGVVATDVGSDDLDGLVEDPAQLRRDLELPPRKK